MLHRIRLALRAGSFEAPMSGPVEGDTTGIGGLEKNKHASKRLHRGTGNVGKAVVFGLLARHGQIRVKAVPNAQAATLQDEIRRNGAVHTNGIESFWANFKAHGLRHSPFRDAVAARSLSR
jgi:hypothetical protein